MRSVWKPVLLSIAISLLLVAITLFVLFRFLIPYEEKEQTRFKPQYVIAEWEGQVAVFKGEDAFPMQVYDTYVDTLPGEIQENLQQGIPVEDETHLSVLLEDYTT